MPHRAGEEGLRTHHVIGFRGNLFFSQLQQVIGLLRWGDVQEFAPGVDIGLKDHKFGRSLLLLIGVESYQGDKNGEDQEPKGP